jgi:hypothetical protein
VGKANPETMKVERAIAKDIMHEYYAGNIRNMAEVEIQYRKRAGRFRCYEFIKTHSREAL